MESEGAANNGAERVRDRRRKVKLPVFGFVYKRQLIVHAISVVLIAAYITLISLV